MAPETHQDANLTPPPAGVASVPTVDAEGVDIEMWAALGRAQGQYPAYANPSFASGFIEGWQAAREVVALRERVERAEGQLAAALRSANINGDQAERAEDRAALLRFHRRMETRASGYKGFCSECGLKWFGPPDVGGCEAVLLAREVVALRKRAETAEVDARDCLEGATTLRAALRDIRGARDAATARVAVLEGLLRDLAAKGEAMKEAFFTGDDNREAIACMEWDDAAAAALADGGREDSR